MTATYEETAAREREASGQRVRDSYEKRVAAARALIPKKPPFPPKPPARKVIGKRAPRTPSRPMSVLMHELALDLKRKGHDAHTVASAIRLRDKHHADEVARAHPLIQLAHRTGALRPPWEKPKVKKRKAEPDAAHRRYQTEFIERELAKLAARNRALRKQGATHPSPGGFGEQ